MGGNYELKILNFEVSSLNFKSIMTSPQFSQLYNTLKRYEAIIVTLEATNSPSREQILDLLIARDAVQAALMAQTPAPRWSLLQVNELDNRLKGQSKLIVQSIDLADLADLRSIINPSASTWWWFLDESPFHPQNRRDWLWKGISIVLLTISFGVGTSVYSSWFSIGLDALGSFFASAQGVATLLLGSRLFRTEENQPLFGYSKIPKYFWHQRICQMSFLLTGSVLSLYFLQPNISDLYTKRGRINYNAIPKQIASAKANFERATKLDPDNAEAHYGLGNIYEELGNLKQTQAEYEIAVQGGLPDAYNNLARLYILNQKSDEAAVLLNKGLMRVSKQDKEVEYSLRKNLGWARLEQKRYSEAEAQLRTAIQLTDDLKREGKLKPDLNQAAPYCLLAQVLEHKEQLSEAQKNWKNCKQYANPSNSPEEDSWLHLANQRLKKGGKPSCDTDC